MTVQENFLKIKGHLPQTVTLVAVSKTKPIELILQVYEAGHKDFGENYVQELVDKHEQLPKDIHWHFIGHLQTNKVKLIVPFVYLIHGVDSVKLLKEINKQAEKINITVNCLLQLFIAKEETKFGLDYKECEELLSSEEIKELKNINVKGFMAMASNTDSNEQIKTEFRALKNFQTRMLAINPKLTVLSFGMSGDYPLAIECGSNMVRLGSSIFGNRTYINH